MYGTYFGTGVPFVASGGFAAEALMRGSMLFACISLAVAMITGVMVIRRLVSRERP